MFVFKVVLETTKCLNVSSFQQNTQLAHYCGEDMPNPRTIRSTTDRLLVRFLSDYSLAGNGFRLEWRIQGCGGLFIKVRKLHRNSESGNLLHVILISIRIKIF